MRAISVEKLGTPITIISVTRTRLERIILCENKVTLQCWQTDQILKNFKVQGNIRIYQRINLKENIVYKTLSKGFIKLIFGLVLLFPLLWVR